MAQTIRAEMVASVHSILMAQGDSVVVGDTLAILESMKMEIPVLAEENGTIGEISVAVGDVVREGDIIAIIL
jgi:biotin carboxyl carrier protein